MVGDHGLSGSLTFVLRSTYDFGVAHARFIHAGDGRVAQVLEGFAFYARLSFDVDKGMAEIVGVPAFARRAVIHACHQMIDDEDGGVRRGVNIIRLAVGACAPKIKSAGIEVVAVVGECRMHHIARLRSSSFDADDVAVFFELAKGERQNKEQGLRGFVKVDHERSGGIMPR